ncbi:DUF4124 domain-containing protein [Neptunicella sp.]|uniref:DUF4124 domain-containing protein n=1 Tax=Neptunicella sp. TaxID=2125986 RepID=UPI003F693B0E
MKALTLCFYLLCTVTYAGQLYKVIQQDGSVVYTDIPTGNAQPVDLSSANSAVMPAYQGKIPTTTRNQKVEKTSVSHQLIISSPTEQQTIRNNNGELSVVASIEPKASGIAQLFLDGKMLIQQASLNFTLHNIDRGEHVISIKLVSQSGKLIASSQDRVFYLHKASVLTRPN